MIVVTVTIVTKIPKITTIMILIMVIAIVTFMVRVADHDDSNLLVSKTNPEALNLKPHQSTIVTLKKLETGIVTNSAGIPLCMTF